MSHKLQGKVVVITGGAGLIGRSIVKAVVENGGTCILADMNESVAVAVLKELRDKHGDETAYYVKLDIASPDSVSGAIKHVTDKFGKIDALVNSAYPKNKNYGRLFESVSYRDFCENMDMHLGGYFLTSQQAALKMIGQGYGNIINIGSTYGFAAPRFEIYEGTQMTMPVEYAAIKGGVINLTRYMASYLAKYNIRVNCLSPGGVFDNQPESFVKKYSEFVLCGKRMARVEDLTGPLVFLLSDDSSYITGQNLVVDGGWTL